MPTLLAFVARLSDGLLLFVSFSQTSANMDIIKKGDKRNTEKCEYLSLKFGKIPPHY